MFIFNICGLGQRNYREPPIMRDYEKEVFERLQGELKHFCPDWDGMAIDETMPEIEGCTCATHRLYREKIARLQQRKEM